ncbi:T9SS type A sorting domain-containing protein, partial [candidate division WOR-3 bacterium]|nr:T9SS type A sorting domain-containing protein [candidate division WOR-3 bacterium]
LYIGQGSYKKLYVYDYLADSCLKVIDVSAVTASYPDACIFSRTHRRAYVSSFQFEPLGGDKVGIVDTDRDTLLRVLSVRVTNGLYKQAAVDERDGKVYIVDCSGSYYYPDTMWVVDCATDSVIKKFECAPFGADARTCIRWAPWSNRIYLINDFGSDTGGSLVVIDCNTDSVIVPSMLRGGQLRDIQIDPIRQRVFVIGDTNKVYVLRDVEGGVAEETASTGHGSVSGLQVKPTVDGHQISYSIATTCWVDVSVYDLMGREVRRLVAEEQPAGEHQLLWNCQDSVGSPVARGVYLIRLETPSVADTKKVVVTRCSRRS